MEAGAPNIQNGGVTSKRKGQHKVCIRVWASVIADSSQKWHLLQDEIKKAVI